jgi:hypothetical protein
MSRSSPGLEEYTKHETRMKLVAIRVLLATCFTLRQYLTLSLAFMPSMCNVGYYSLVVSLY